MSWCSTGAELNSAGCSTFNSNVTVAEKKLSQMSPGNVDSCDLLCYVLDPPLSHGENWNM